MSDKLEEKLTNIEEKLGGTEEVPADSQDKLGWHLDYIESLIGGSGGDVQLKTLNNEELKGEGNIEIPVVTANPETTGEETALNSLQVGDNKFVLGGGTNVESIALDKDATPLAGLQIGDTSYRLLPLGTVVNAGHIAIGEGSSAYGTYENYGASIAIGTNSKANSHAALAIGRGATCNGQTGVAIGYSSSVSSNDGVAVGRSASAGSNGATAVGLGAKAGAYNSSAFGHNALNRITGPISGTTCPTVTFDGKSSSDLPIFHIYDSTKIFFRNDYSLDASKTCADYTSGHYLSEYIKNNTLTEASGLYYPSYTDANNYQTFTKNVVSGTATAIDKKITGVHITIKASGSSSHSVVGLDLLLFDATNNYGFNSYGRIDVDGTINDISATINSDGLIAITAPSGLTIDEVLYSIR